MENNNSLKANINSRLCKGCGICVLFCPKKIIEVKQDKAFINNIDDCIGCRQCEYHCPDFAIVVGDNNG